MKTQPTYSGLKLTKQFLMSPPQGAYLVSNVSYEPGQPIFADVVGPLDQRKAQWLEVKKLRCDGRTCDVFESREHYNEYRKSFKVIIKPPEQMTERQKQAAELIREMEKLGIGPTSRN